jgi:hypothetical protein
VADDTGDVVPPGADGGARLRALRLVSQGLAGPRARTPIDVVDRLLAVQAQDERGFRLAVRSRTTGATAADVDRALAGRQLLVTWLNRGTLHLVRPDDYRWVHPLVAPRVLPGVVRRLGQLGAGPRDIERRVDTVLGALGDEGPLDRHALRDRLDAAGVPTAGQTLVHLLAVASLHGHVVRGPVVDGRHAFVLVDDWLGTAPAPLDRDEALGRLARRYLAGHAPATPRDLATWAGITLGDARTGFAAAGDDVVATPEGTVPADGRPDPPADALPRLLGPFDPVLHGWQDRAPFVGRHRSVVTTNGIFRACCLVDGRVVGTWTLPSGRVTIDLLESVAAPARAALAEDADDVLRFLGRRPAPVRMDGPGVGTRHRRRASG